VGIRRVQSNYPYMEKVIEFINGSFGALVGCVVSHLGLAIVFTLNLGSNRASRTPNYIYQLIIYKPIDFVYSIFYILA
jgi:hypothetical protein